MDKFSGELRCHLNPFNHPILGFVIAYLCERTLTVRPLFLHHRSIARSSMREEIPQALCSLSLDVARGLRNNGLVPNPCYVLSSSSGDLCRAAPPHASEVASAKSGHLDEWENGAHMPPIK